MDIAVLSGGNGAHAAAADLTEQGHRVRFWRRDRAAIDALQAAGSRLTLKDYRGTREVDVAVVTHDMGEALRGAGLILCPAPAFAQADIARAMAPHVADGQVVLLTPGTFGSYLMARIVRQAGARARVAFAETGTLPYLARKHGPQPGRHHRAAPRGYRRASFRWPTRRACSASCAGPIPRWRTRATRSPARS